jgi:hypothetical protein
LIATNFSYFGDGTLGVQEFQIAASEELKKSLENLEAATKELEREKV